MAAEFAQGRSEKTEQPTQESPWSSGIWTLLTSAATVLFTVLCPAAARGDGGPSRGHARVSSGLSLVFVPRSSHPDLMFQISDDLEDRGLDGVITRFRVKVGSGN